jgi:periplasmic divalent cation tolerance protein
MSKAEFSLIYMTCRNAAEARRIGGALVGERLVACVNVLGPVKSIYRWKGRVVSGREVAMVAKTRSALVARVIERVRALHSYEVPCVVEFPIARGNPEFLAWLSSETRPRSRFTRTQT